MFRATVPTNNTLDVDKMDAGALGAMVERITAIYDEALIAKTPYEAISALSICLGAAIGAIPDKVAAATLEKAVLRILTAAGRDVRDSFRLKLVK